MLLNLTHYVHANTYVTHTHTPVDACRVHKVSDVSALLLDGLKGFLHLLLLGDVTAESQVVRWRGRHRPGWKEADASCDHVKTKYT